MISNSTKLKPVSGDSASAMKELLKQYASYNAWANQKLADVILSLGEEQHHKEVSSSFTSLHKTLLHVWDSDSVWWQRLRLHERIIIPSENFNGSTRDVLNGLLNQSRQLEDWIANASEMSLSH